MNGGARSCAVLVLTIPLTAGCLQELMPTPNLVARSDDDFFRDVPQAQRSNSVEVVYATDRQPLPARQGIARYGSERSVSLRYGTCLVTIGGNISWEELVRESQTQRRTRRLTLSLEKTQELGQFPAAPTPMVLEQGRLIENPQMLAELTESERGLRDCLSRRLAQTPRRELFIYIHGFKSTFQDAAFVVAELWHFMGRTGVPVIYTWPAGSSEGALAGYARDRESGEFTVYHLKQFLRTIAACPELEKVHVLAHSRGTDVLTTALRELNIEYRAAGKDTRSQLKLGNVVLAAADLDIEVTAERIAAERLHLVPERMTVYICESDRAIGLADWLFGSKRRLGQLRSADLTPEQREGLAALAQVQLIDARVRTDFLGHSYFHTNSAVSSDLILLLRDNLAPGAENGRPLTKRADGFWELRDGYPQNPGN